MTQDDKGILGEYTRLRTLSGPKLAPGQEVRRLANAFETTLQDIGLLYLIDDPQWCEKLALWTLALCGIPLASDSDDTEDGVLGEWA